MLMCEGMSGVLMNDMVTFVAVLTSEMQFVLAAAREYLNGMIKGLLYDVSVVHRKLTDV